MDGVTLCLSDCIQLLGGLRGTEFKQVWSNYGGSIRNLSDQPTDADVVRYIWMGSLEAMRFVISEEPAKEFEHPEPGKRLRKNIRKKIKGQHIAGLNSETNFKKVFGTGQLVQFLLAMYDHDYQSAAEIAQEFTGSEGLRSMWMFNASKRKQD